MAYGQAKHCISVPAGEDLTNKEFLLVGLDGKLGGDGSLAYPLQNEAASTTGEPASLCIAGVSEVYLGGTVTAGAALACGAGGKAVAATAGKQIIGYALESGAANELRTMLVVLNGTAA